MAPNTDQLTASGVRIEDLTRRFGDHLVLDGVDLDIAPGEFIALLGRSGSGKSTLLRALAGLDHDVVGSGDLRIPDRVSVVFQDSRLLPWRRVLDNVILGPAVTDRAVTNWAGRGRSGADRAAQARRKGREALAEVGLAGRERAWPHELSGGEQQRVALARSLVGEPELLLADEPFGALDALTRIRMHGLLRALCRRHQPAVLLVTHDVDEAVLLADRIVVLDNGRISLDVRPGLPEDRTHRDPGFQQARELLLKALGVDT